MKFLAFIYRTILSLRYKVTIHGKEVLQKNNVKLFLPNHQAIADPQLIVAHVLKYGTIAPAITDRYYDSKLLNPLFKKLNAIRVTDLTTDTSDAEVLNDLYTGMLDALKKGHNGIIYPSGQTAGQGFEKIFNKQSAHLIVSKLPDNVTIVGVRVHGLWGSIWSRAWTGKSPNFIITYIKGIIIALANLLFLIPKRDVSLEFVDLTKELKEKSTEGRTQFNNYLENFYNAKGEEKVRFIKHYFFVPKSKRHLPAVIEGSLKHMKSSDSVEISDINSEIYEKVCTILRDTFELTENIEANSNLYLDFGIDSLGAVTLVDAVRQEFPNSEVLPVTEIKTVADICLFLQGKSIKRVEYKPSFLHEHHIDIERLRVLRYKNILENYIHIFTHNSTMPFAFDATSGCSRRKDFFLKSLVVAELIKKRVKEEYVGIMLPSLQNSTLLIIACYIAKKTPVMLNWTVGHKVLSHCVETSGISKIITATAFYNKVQEQIPDELSHKLLLFDKEVPTISVGMKLKGLFKSKFPFLINTKVPDHAVVLFTSGSESMPKAVALTHKNIVSNIDDLFTHLSIPNDTIFLSFLPPFHSFGFSILSILPLICGAKIAYTPDPTAVGEVLRILRHTEANMIFGTPTFLKMLMAKARDTDLLKMRFAISGAERLPADIKERFEKMTENGLLIEGYGITECSPVLTANLFEMQKNNSVGVTLPSLDVRIIDIETQKVLGLGKEGMIIASGDSIFSGYLDKEIESPFITIDNKQFYKTGDLGYFDEDGYLFITGRLKRFVKVAGEMISLPFIEDILNEKYPSDELTFAVEGIENEGKASIVLFSTIDDLNPSEINKYLRSKGVSPIAKIAMVEKVEEIPLLGTGKVNYRFLKDRVKELIG